MSVPLLGAAVVAAIDRPTWDRISWVLLGCTVCTLCGIALKLHKAHEEDRREVDDQSHTGIYACLHVLHAMVEYQAKIEFGKQDARDFDLRVTFHRVVEPLDDASELEQLVDYVGSRGGGRGRRFNIQSGITGQAVRVNAVYVMDRDVESVEEYRSILISEWNYRRSEAEKLRADRFSAIAVPITAKSDNDLVLGVVYLDTKMQNFFNRERLQECVVNSCAGLSRYIGERYDR